MTFVKRNPIEGTQPLYLNINTMKEIQTSIRIHATPARVWVVLTDFECYPQWNPFVASLTGDVAVGNTIRVQLPGMAFTPVVLTFQENRSFSWKGKLGVTGIFDGEHRFNLVDNGDGTTRFEHSERFSGILVHLFSSRFYAKTQESFEKLNLALKARVEKM